MKNELLIDFKNKQFKGSAGRMSLWDVKIPKTAHSVIVFAHGYKGYKDWGAWPLMEDFFLSSGYGFVKFNFSHNGGTVEDPIDFPDLQAFGENRYSYEINELNGIVNEVDRMIKDECGMNIPIHVIGHSRGGGVATLVGSRHSLVNKIVSLAGISDIPSRFPTGDELLDWQVDGVRYIQNGRTNQEMPHFFSFYLDYFKNKELLDIEAAARKIGEIEKPFLQVHGDMDLAVSISEGQGLAGWTGTRLCIIKGAGHTFGAAQPWNSDDLPEDFKLALTAIDAFLKE